jgi:hypothetical protein
MRARLLLERLLSESESVEFESTVTIHGDCADVPVIVTATPYYNQGVRGAAGDEPGWYVDIDFVREKDDGRDVPLSQLDDQTISRLELETLDHFEH